MCSNLAENITCVFDVINSIISFVQAGSADSLTKADITELFGQSHYVEAVYSKLELNNLQTNFNNQLEIYLNAKGKSLPSNLNFSVLCDLVLSKFISHNVSNALTSWAISQYLKYCSKERFEHTLLNLAELRSLFLTVSKISLDLAESSQIESALLVKSWEKILNSSHGLERIKCIIDQMISDPDCADTLLGILCQDNKLIIDCLLAWMYERQSSEPSLKIWNKFVNSHILWEATRYCPDVLKLILKILGDYGKLLAYDFDLGMWTGRSNSVLSYENIVNILKKLFEIRENRSIILKYISYNIETVDRGLWSLVDNEIRTL